MEGTTNTGRPAPTRRGTSMTRIAVIGAHGKVGQQILHLLYDAGH